MYPSLSMAVDAQPLTSRAQCLFGSVRVGNLALLAHPSFDLLEVTLQLLVFGTKIKTNRELNSFKFIFFLALLKIIY